MELAIKLFWCIWSSYPNSQIWASHKHKSNKSVEQEKSVLSRYPELSETSPKISVMHSKQLGGRVAINTSETDKKWKTEL